jgi:hypothetical protein
VLVFSQYIETRCTSDSSSAPAVASIFGKLGLPPSENDNRRVLAVLHYLDSTLAQ